MSSTVKSGRIKIASFSVSQSKLFDIKVFFKNWLADAKISLWDLTDIPSWSLITRSAKSSLSSMSLTPSPSCSWYAGFIFLLFNAFQDAFAFSISFVYKGLFFNFLGNSVTRGLLPKLRKAPQTNNPFINSKYNKMLKMFVLAVIFVINVAVAIFRFLAEFAAYSRFPQLFAAASSDFFPYISVSIIIFVCIF